MLLSSLTSLNEKTTTTPILQQFLKQVLGKSVCLQERNPSNNNVYVIVGMYIFGMF